MKLKIGRDRRGKEERRSLLQLPDCEDAAKKIRVEKIRGTLVVGMVGGRKKMSKKIRGMGSNQIRKRKKPNGLARVRISSYGLYVSVRNVTVERRKNRVREGPRAREALDELRDVFISRVNMLNIENDEIILPRFPPLFI
ncbi:hypothetical protein FRX31_028196 [Thalictrum thalictroides]|uniref:Uncharacterized protein n=1 Tax=Thalictrum thalictroides TaxID=46969 RepID=A0A7J6VBU4_THATH|nr:hypothetical protein FRX31_028196 [Thalictrum thalictroides]